MQKEKGETFLSQAEVAALLQTHMPNKNAASWLASDRQNDPLLPYTVVGDEIQYCWSDLTTFIIKHLDPAATFDDPQFHPALQRRGEIEQRYEGERRICVEQRQRLDRRQPAIAGRRQRIDLDRRLRGGIDRRAASN
jgi:hypothetical protein